MFLWKKHIGLPKSLEVINRLGNHRMTSAEKHGREKIELKDTLPLVAKDDDNDSDDNVVNRTKQNEIGEYVQLGRLIHELSEVAWLVSY